MKKPRLSTKDLSDPLKSKKIKEISGHFEDALLNEMKKGLKKDISALPQSKKKGKKIPISQENKAKIIKIIDSIGSKGFDIFKANKEFAEIFLRAKPKNK